MGHASRAGSARVAAVILLVVGAAEASAQMVERAPRGARAVGPAAVVLPLSAPSGAASPALLAPSVLPNLAGGMPVAAPNAVPPAVGAKVGAVAATQGLALMPAVRPAGGTSPAAPAAAVGSPRTSVETRSAAAEIDSAPLDTPRSRRLARSMRGIIAALGAAPEETAPPLGRGTRDLSGARGRRLRPAAPAAEEPAKAVEYRPRAAVRGLGAAALFAGLLPTIVGLTSVFHPDFHGADVPPWVAATVLAVGAPMLGFGLRVLSRLDRRRFPPAPGDASTGNPEMAGFLLGMGSWLFFPLLFERIIGHAAGMPLELFVGGGLIAGTAMAFLGLDAVKGKTSASAASPWVSFAGYVSGVALSVAAAAAHSSLGILAGWGVMLAVGAGSLFLGGAWRRLWPVFAWARRRARGLETRFATLSERQAALTGVFAGTLLWLALHGLSPLFAIAPVAGALAGFLLARRRGAGRHGAAS